MKRVIIFSILAVSAFLISGCTFKSSICTDCDTPVPKPAPVKTTNVSPKYQQKPQAKVIPQVQVSRKLDDNICFVLPGKKGCVLTIEAKGIGVAECNSAKCSKAKAIGMARRSAILDAYKALAERMYGVKIKGRDSVRNLVLENSYLQSYVDGVVRGAKVEFEEYKDGIYSVTMSVKLDPTVWAKYLNNQTIPY